MPMRNCPLDGLGPSRARITVNKPRTYPAFPTRAGENMTTSEKIPVQTSPNPDRRGVKATRKNGARETLPAS